MLPVLRKARVATLLLALVLFWLSPTQGLSSLFAAEMAAPDANLASQEQLLPGFSKSFSPETIGPGSISTLTFTITNQGSVPVESLAFVDILPTGVTIATPGNPTTNCQSGVVTGQNGGDTIELSGGKLGANASCQVQVHVTSLAVGTHTNTSSDLTSSAGNSGTASANLTVATDRPGFTKSFSPGTIQKGQRSRLTFTIDNTANTAGAHMLAFTDNLPTGLVVASPPNAINSCGGSLTATAGTTSIALSSSASLATVAAGSSCTIRVDVRATGIGTLGNVTGELTSTPPTFNPSRSSGKAGAVLSVPFDFLRLEKVFVDDPIPPGGTGLLQFTIRNFDRGRRVTQIAFTDDLDAALSGLKALSLPLNNPCGVGSAISGSGLLTFSGGVLEPEAACTFSVRVQVPETAVPGSYTNTSSGISGLYEGDEASSVGQSAVDALFVEPAPLLTKSYIDDPVGGGSTVTLEFSITNTSPDKPVTGIGFSDEFPAIIQSAAALPAGGFCGVGSSAQFQSPSFSSLGTLVISGGNLAAADSCAFQVVLNVIIGAPGGIYPNTTSAIRAVVDGLTVSGDGASDDLQVVGAPRLVKEFIDDPVLPGSIVTLEFTLSHATTAAGPVTDISFTDDLSAVLSGLASTSAAQIDICGVGSSLSGTTLLTFSGGALDPGESCTFSVDLQVPAGIAPGNYANTTSGVSATVLDVAITGNGASDDLKVSTLTLSKSFIDDPALPGRSVTLQFTIDNLSSSGDATDITFIDDLGATLAGLTATDLPISDVCGSGSSLTGSAGDTRLHLLGGSVAATESCTFSVVLSVPSNAPSATYRNRTSGFSATVDGQTVQLENATDLLTVSSALLALSKSFTDDPVLPGGTVNLSFTVENLSTAHTVSDITFTDDLSAALAGLASVSGVQSTPLCGAGSQMSGTGLLTFSGGSLPPKTSCTINVQVAVPGSVAFGASALNITSAASGLVGAIPVQGDAARDRLQIATLTVTADAGGEYFVDEGSEPYTITGSTTAAGVVDFSWDLDNNGTFETGGESFVFDPGAIDGPASFPIVLQVRPSGGGQPAFDATTITVLNVAPTIALSGAANVDEGSTYELTLGAVTDPGDDTVSEYIVYWGDGSSDSYSTNGVVTHVYDDGPSSPTISVDLVDEDGTHNGASSLSLTVDNVAPTIALSGAANVDEGSTYELTLGAVTDPGDDKVGEYIVHWGDGSSDPYSTNGVVTHVYDDGPSPLTISVDLVDEDGTFVNAGSLDIEVDNVPPSATFSAPTPVKEGEVIPLTLTNQSDPSVADTNVGFTYAFDCGSGTLTPAAGPSASCPTAGDAGWRTVRAEIRDKDGGATIYSLDVYVKPSREVKSDLRDEIAGLIPAAGKNDAKELQKAVDFLNKALEDQFWAADGSRLTQKGNKVFDGEKGAVMQLRKVIGVSVSHLINGLVTVDQVLATVEILDAEAANGNPAELAIAYNQMGLAQAERDAGRPDKAIDRYKKAWHHARLSVGLPVESAESEPGREIIQFYFEIYLPLSAK